MVKQGFIAGGLLAALLLALLWRVSAMAQEGYGNGVVNGLIATVTASGASSIQLTGASWSTNYNSLFLNCSGIRAGTSGATLALKVAESALGFTTSADYTSANYNTQVNNASDILNMSAVTLALNSTSDAFLRFTINNPGSSTVNKVISGIWGGGVTEDAYGGFAEVTGWWNADTNALTGIELVPSSGTISGTCTLYGIP